MPPDDFQTARPEPVTGTTFEPSPGKGLGGVLGGLFLMTIPTVVVVWRLGYFTLDNRRPTLFFTGLAVVVGLMGFAFMCVSVAQMLRKRRVVIGADRVQVVQKKGGEDVVTAQVMFANVEGLAVVKTEAGKQANVKLADRRAEGTFDTINAIRAWQDGQGFDFVIDNHYQGKLEDLVQAIDDAILAWREAQPEKAD